VRATKLSIRGNPPAAVDPERSSLFADGLFQITGQLEAHHREQRRACGPPMTPILPKFKPGAASAALGALWSRERRLDRPRTDP
jgi:hypothetical protein